MAARGAIEQPKGLYFKGRFCIRLAEWTKHLFSFREIEHDVSFVFVDDRKFTS